MSDMGMGMGTGMGTGGDGFSVPLNASGVDFSNETQALNFLGEMLDDTVFQVDGNAFARYFWYGMVVFIGIAGICNVTWRVTLKLRCVLESRLHHAGSFVDRAAESELLPPTGYDLLHQTTC